MIVLSRLHRGDNPHYRPVTAEQSDGRLVFTDKAGVDAFIEAYRRADPAASFTMHVVPETTLHAFWEACRDHDWHYENSEDQRVWREGGAVASRLATQATISFEHKRIYLDWKRHHFTGPAYGTERRPPPDEPASHPSQITDREDGK
jgi:hypothetical protein